MLFASHRFWQITRIHIRIESSSFCPVESAYTLFLVYDFWFSTHYELNLFHSDCLTRGRLCLNQIWLRRFLELFLIIWYPHIGWPFNKSKIIDDKRLFVRFSWIFLVVTIRFSSSNNLFQSIFNQLPDGEVIGKLMHLVMVALPPIGFSRESLNNNSYSR